MDKWEKIVEIDRLLSNYRYPVPVDTILETLHCSLATFYRLLRYMKDVFSAPIEYDKKYNGYYYMVKDGEKFELPGLWFTSDEIEALFCFNYTLQNLEAGIFKEILEPLRKKIETILRAQKIKIKDFYTKVKIIPIHSRRFDNKLLKTVATAVIRKKCLQITHWKLGEKERVVRVISPHALVRYKDNWYLDAYCHLRGELRTFALNRIEKAEVKKDKFVDVSEEEKQKFFASSYGIFSGTADKFALVNFYGIAAEEVSCEIWHPGQKGKWINQTTYQLYLPYKQSKELVMDILGWGSMAEVVEPLELRLEIKEEIQKMSKIY